MARVVFFSFHHGGDSKRVGVVRNHHITKNDFTEAGYIDGVDWEKIKLQNDDSIKRWINRQLEGTTVTIVLIGKDTSKRPWVNYEIEQSFKKGNALIGVYIHNIKGLDQVTTLKGDNPFKNFTIGDDNQSLSNSVPMYDWVNDDGYNNFSKWVESAYTNWKKDSDIIKRVANNSENTNLSHNNKDVFDKNEQFIENLGITTNIQYRLDINSEVKQDGFREFFLKGSKYPLRKKRSLNFFIENCTVPRPYKIKWKIKNTGDEAKSVGVMRGEIIDDDGTERRKESTSYSGNHYVECYIIKDNVCVAKQRLDVPIGLN